MEESEDSKITDKEELCVRLAGLCHDLGKYLLTCRHGYNIRGLQQFRDWLGIMVWSCGWAHHFWTIDHLLQILRHNVIILLSVS